MKCVICKHGSTKSGRATITLERGGTTVVIKGVPAEVCANCEIPIARRASGTGSHRRQGSSWVKRTSRVHSTRSSAFWTMRTSRTPSLGLWRLTNTATGA
jgi:YgiT-type zinc finger domain-containing protein